jgi:hypothetical protein
MLDPVDRSNLGGRLAIMAFATLSLTAPVVLASLLSPRGGRWQVAAPLAATLLLVVAMPRPDSIASPHSFLGPGPARPPSAMAPAFEALASQLPADAVVVAPSNQWAFMTTWYALVPAGHPVARGWSVDAPTHRLLLQFHLPPRLWDDLERWEARRPADVPAPIHALPESPRRMTVFPEATWRAWVAELSPTDRLRAERYWAAGPERE